MQYARSFTHIHSPLSHYSPLRLVVGSSVLSPSGVTACINVYGLSAQPKKALALLKRMQERGVGVNVVQVTAHTVAVTLT